MEGLIDFYLGVLRYFICPTGLAAYGHGTEPNRHTNLVSGPDPLLRPAKADLRSSSAFVWSERVFRCDLPSGFVATINSPSGGDDNDLNSQLLTTKTIRAPSQMASQSPHPLCRNVLILPVE